MSERRNRRLSDADGTQASAPPRTYTDPLAGLAGSVEETELIDQESMTSRGGAEALQFDTDTVRDMVERALSDQAEHTGGRHGGTSQDNPASSNEPAGSTGAGQPVGMLPQQRGWRSRPPQLRRPKWGGLRKPAQAAGQDGEANRPKPSSGSTGIVVAIVLFIVFAIVVIQLLSSLFSGIAGLFG